MQRQRAIGQFYDRWTPVMVAAAGTTLQGGLVTRTATPSSPAASARYLAELAGVAPGDRVLDAGCGVGGPALAIACGVPDVVIDGVTVSEVQVRMARDLIARAGLGERVRVHLADFHRLPFRPAVFDLALFLEVTGYSPDRGLLYREAARVLRPGGTVYVKDVFCRDGPLTPRQRSSMAAFDELWACVRSPTLTETVGALRAAGLVDVSAREYPFVDTQHFYESTVSRDESGLRLNTFGEAFLRFFPELPAFFGEVRARKAPVAEPAA
jgi:cyclopropane fatty-acyl-phospholipid synthase-like methyltransferase